MSPRKLSSAQRRLCWLILGPVCLLALSFVAAEMRLTLLPFQRDYGEGHVLWMAQQIFDSRMAYKVLDGPPYVVFPYTPLYLAASRLAGGVTRDLLLAGRSLSLVCTLGIGLLIALTIWLVTPVRAPKLCRLASAVFGGVVPLLADSVVEWASLMRVDMLALFLMQAGLAVYVVLGRRERWQYAAAVLFVLALFTKQTMLSAPLACLIFGFVADRRGTVRSGALALLLGAGGVVCLNAATNGGFLENVVDYNVHHFSWKSAVMHVYLHVRACPSPLLVAAAALAGAMNPVALRRLGVKRFLEARCLYDRALLICGLNWLLAGLLTLSIGKAGSYHNFFLGLDISTGVLAGLFLFRLLCTWSRRGRRHRTVTLLSVLLLTSLLLPPDRLIQALLSARAFQAREEASEQMVRVVRETPGPVLSEDLLLLYQAGKAVEVEPATLTFVTLAGGWNEQPYLDMLSRGHFRLLVVLDLHGMQRYTPAAAATIERAYFLERRIDRYSLYRPAGETPAAR